ncbi:aldehyde dehydrogenase [Mycena maculata]|uniref:Aldehyde dehydrogenase n=1 Tax=Mycena maculata TaxID=230809 RepID=A0AAD7JB19_9AGAR|nr:aldehyde dehydrogenase [Mycena maculata]
MLGRSPRSTPCRDWQTSWKPTIYRAANGTVLIVSPWFRVSSPRSAQSQRDVARLLSLLNSPLLADLLPSTWIPLLIESSSDLGAVPKSQDSVGSHKIARIISTAAAKHLTPLPLELGGKSPVILCVPPDYVLIPRSHHDAFLDALRACAAEFFPEGSMHSSPISRIGSPARHARLVDLLMRTQGEVVLGGGTDGTAKINIEGFVCGSLTVLDIFGPLLPIAPVDSLEEAIGFARNRDRPPALYVFTENAELKKQVLDHNSLARTFYWLGIARIPLSLVNEIPFGGVGESGHGTQILKYPYDAFSYERSSIDVPKEAEPFNAVRYAPYTEDKFKAMTAAVFLPIPSA